MHTITPASLPEKKTKSKINKIGSSLIIGFALIIITFLFTLAQNPNFMVSMMGGHKIENNDSIQNYYIGKVLEVPNKEELENLEAQDLTFFEAPISVEVLNNANVEKTITSVPNSDINFFDYDNNLLLKEGDEVILMQSTLSGNDTFYLIDRLRIDNAIYLVIAFLIIAVIFSGIKGFSSFLGLCFSLLVLVGFVVPQIMSGKDPLFITLVGSTIIGILSLYLSHGINKKTTIAVVSTFISILVAVILASISISLTDLVGVGEEESLFLVTASSGTIDLRGILLSGIIIGTLGVLDDITTAQAAIVEELKIANKNLTFKKLYNHAINVGKEHIASLINTLVMAYAGSSFPLFILLISITSTPLWVTLSREFMVEEIVRTIVGSISLILAVPITTLIASYYYSKEKK